MTESHYKNWLRYIADISYDRDGYHSAKDLSDLVDELHKMAFDALEGEDCPIKQFGD